MKLISWNVNGIRAVLKKGFTGFLKSEKPDIVCLQEVKANPEQVDLSKTGYSYIYWSNPKRKGYAGLAVLSKVKPISETNKTGIKQIDEEGRVLLLEFQKFYLINVYFPHSGRVLERLPYKLKFNKAFQDYIKKTEKKKPVIIASDFNVAHKEIDIARPKDNIHNAGFTAQERKWFDEFINSNHVDTFREFVKGPGHYTWWTWRNNARARNIGWRIDYFVVSKSIRNKLKDAFILEKVKGSDHAPVALVLK
jgi:exodeoxyribonuclease-3